ncbi:hypothetical protein FSP39_017535 [Pinctada imbricata]|uniref:Reverse transcriptase domain-containing protein n=1 Tax=Pinctada imbricata TaxID=66713 RepID=A0AA88YC37_PINIB|nr:hypothetical protein FSP39_017535 [Pinctada imbricata]
MLDGVKALDDGENRICVITIDEAICLVNVYLTSRGTEDAERLFEENLDELSEITCKYKDDFTVILTGDFNASLHRKSGLKRDTLLFNMLNHWGFKLHENYPSKPTFYHPNGLHMSQIDYIVSNREGILENTEILENDIINTSTHMALKCDVIYINSGMSLRRSPKRSEVNTNIKRKVDWEKMDKQKYELLVNEGIRNINLEQITDAETCLNVTHQILLEVTDQLVTSKRNKKARNRNRKLISKPMKELSTSCKKLHWKIKNFNGLESEKLILQLQCKEAKKAFRKMQRMEAAENRHEKFREIMSSDANNPKLFFKLIRTQRQGKTNKLSHLFLEDVKLTKEEEIREGWAQYFQKLSQPTEDTSYNEEYRQQIEKDILFIEEACQGNRKSTMDVCAESVHEVITTMKNGKSADAHHITAEHLKLGGSSLWSLLSRLFSLIVKEGTIPEAFKNGIITPVYKKQNKPQENPNSCRRITICSIIGKVFEKLHLNSVQDLLNEQQNHLQRGFTKGTSPVFTSLLLTEAIAEAYDTKTALHATFLDAAKAFDTVWHASMLRRLHIHGLGGTDWLVMKNWYSDMKSQVKWEGSLSSSFSEQQGVRQGGIWSPTAYKMFLNPALDLLERQNIGFRIGTISLVSPTCADVQLLLSHNTHELATITSVQEEFSNMERYRLSEQKSKVMILGNRKTTADEISLNGKALEQVKEYKHIGITRYEIIHKTNQQAIENAVSLGRRTLYSLMGAGLHGYNGISPTVGIKMWNIFMKPRILYGLESLTLKPQDVKPLTLYHKRFLKSVMQLLERTADCGVYIMSGEIPMEAEIDKKSLTQLANIIAGEDVEKKLMRRQLAVKDNNSKSWFMHSKRTLEKYSLPSIYDLVETNVDRRSLGREFKKKVNNHWSQEITRLSCGKTSLRYLNTSSHKVGEPHHIWKDVNVDTMVVKKAGIKAKLVCGVYPLQVSIAKRIGHAGSNICPMCNIEPEDMGHFLLRCNCLTSTRSPFLDKIERILLNKALKSIAQITEDIVVQIILDVTHPIVPLVLLVLQDDDTKHELESIAEQNRTEQNFITLKVI